MDRNSIEIFFQQFDCESNPKDESIKYFHRALESCYPVSQTKCTESLQKFNPV